VPAGFDAYNDNLDHYNTFYWSKLAMARGGTDAQAVVTHYLLSYAVLGDHGTTSTVPHSIKRPLEGRVWYAYPDQNPTAPRAVGSWVQPTAIGRVLDDGTSQIWQATYNDHGMPLSRTDPIGRRTSYTYAANGIDLTQVRQTTGSVNDLVASYGGYTAQHLPTTMTDAAGQTTLATYNAFGQVLTVTNPKSETTTNAYDSAGYLQSVTGPITGATTTYTYDGYGRTRTITDSDGYTVTTDYDVLDRPTRVTYPDGTYEETSYDKLDAVGRRDRLGRWTRLTVDPLQRVVATRDPLGRTITQQWCTCGALDTLVDAKGQRTSWQRDVQARVVQEVRADGVTTTSYTYEPATGRLHTVTDPKGQVTTYTYFADDAIASLSWSNAAVATPSVSFTYEAGYPRTATMVDGTGTTSYAYEPAGTWAPVRLRRWTGRWRTTRLFTHTTSSGA
jgi:YD repeat-containing protein